MRTFTLLAAAVLVLLGGPVGALAMSMNLELRELLPGNQKHVYLCRDCTTAEFAAIPLPGPSWENNATATSARLLQPDSGTNTPPVLDPSVPTELDLLPGIPGPDLFLIAKTLSVAFLGVDPISGFPYFEAQVARGTTMQWDVGRVIHKLVSTTGDEYVMFSIDEAYSQGFAIDTVGGMAGVPLLPGWTYTSELLTSPFVVETPTGIASALSPDAAQSAWQKVTVPEPALTMLALAAAGLLAARRRARR